MWRVVALDQRGHGQSDHALDVPLAWELLVNGNFRARLQIDLNDAGA